MVPFLLPFAIGFIVVLGIGLGLFLWFYQVATPAKALIRRQGSAVLLRGGTFGPASAFEELHMVERDLVVARGAGDSLAITLRPKNEEAAVRSIAGSIGCAAANDSDALSALLVRSLEDPAVAKDATDLVRLAQRAVDSVTPGFVIVSARKLEESAEKTE